MLTYYKSHKRNHGLYAWQFEVRELSVRLGGTNAVKFRGLTTEGLAIEGFWDNEVKIGGFRFQIR
jgi:hypothetical protein